MSSPDIAIVRFARLSTLVVAMVLAPFGGLVVAATAEFAPGNSARLVALYPPWWSPERALAAAAEVAPISGARGVAIGLVAAKPGAAAALRRGGAWLVADGAAFPACFSTPSPAP